MDRNYLNSTEITEFTRDLGVKKANNSFINLLILGFMAGMFVALASFGSMMASYNLLANPDTYGLGKALLGVYFPIALMFVLIAGGELFTGNTLIVVAVLEKKTTLFKMLRNWVIVYFGNLLGSVFIAYLAITSNLFSSSNGLFGGVLIKTAAYKVGLPFGSAFAMGILCNLIVCLAVFMAYAAKDITGKCMVMFFAISLFACSGYEHCVANMYYIPAGIMAKFNPAWAEASHLTAEQLSGLNVNSFIINNLLPVTLGNIIGGMVLVGIVYWFVFIKNAGAVKK